MFAVKLGNFTNTAAKSAANEGGPNNGLFVWDRECSWMAKTDFTNIGIWFSGFRVIWAGTKHLAFGFELNVDFHADNGGVGHRVYYYGLSTIAPLFGLEKILRGSGSF